MIDKRKCIKNPWYNNYIKLGQSHTSCFQKENDEPYPLFLMPALNCLEHFTAVFLHFQKFVFHNST